MSLRTASSSIKPILRRSTTILCESSRSLSFTPIRNGRNENYYNPWPFKSHLKAAPTLPPPLPAVYPQRILLSDGSTFTSYTTAPTPSIVRLTRDVTNNSLWAPGTEKRVEGGQEGRVGKFRRRFEGIAEEDESGGEDESVGKREAQFNEADLSWMSEGARVEKAPTPTKKPASKKRR